MENLKGDLEKFNTSDFYLFQLGFNTPFLDFINESLIDRSKMEMKIGLLEKEVNSKGEKFKDKNFQPGPSSIGNKVDKNIKWMNIRSLKGSSELFPKDFLRKFDYNENNIHGVMSAIKAIITKPNCLSRFFHFKDLNQKDIYAFWISQDGKFDITEVDGEIPSNNENQTYFYSKGVPGLWLPLLEKGLAKSFGSFEAVIESSTIEIIRSISGIPINSINMSNANFSEEIGQCLNKGYFILCQPKIPQHLNHLNNLNYSIQGITNDEGNSRKFILISPYEQKTELCNHLFKNESLFLVSEEQLKENFENVDLFLLRFIFQSSIPIIYSLG